MEIFGINAAFLTSLLSIVLIDVVLSGDNSIVIALAVRSLPDRQRRQGILLGAGAAAVLRIVFTTIATRLLTIPYLKLAGGLLIFWIALKLLADNHDETPENQRVGSLWKAVWIIVVADFTMSLDNVLGVAGAAHGSMALLWFGLALSIPLVVFASGVLSKLMEKYPIIVLLGAAVLGKVAGEMIAGDHGFSRFLTGIPHAVRVFEIAGVAAILIYWLFLKRRRAKAGKRKASHRHPPKH